MNAQQNNYATISTANNDSLKGTLVNNAQMNSLMGIASGVSDYEKYRNGVSKSMEALSFGQKIKNNALPITKGIAGGLAGGVIGAIPMGVTEYASKKATDKLTDYYMKKDKDASLLHAGAIALPGVAASAYGFGAMMHAMDNQHHLINKKGWRNKANALKHMFNPVEHVKRSIFELKDGAKAFKPSVKMTKFERFMKGGNLLGVGLATIPGIMYYFNKKNERKNMQQNQQNVSKYTPYADDIVNVGARMMPKTASENNSKKGNYQIFKEYMNGDRIPIYHSLIELSKANTEANAVMARNRLLKEIAGLGVIGYGVYKGVNEFSKEYKKTKMLKGYYD